MRSARDLEAVPLRGNLTPTSRAQALEMGIRLGQPILLENVLESLDPTLEPILANQTYKDSTGTIVIKLGDTVIPYHSDFRFALTTVMPNPHYGPEVSVKVTPPDPTHRPHRWRAHPPSEYGR